MKPTGLYAIISFLLLFSVTITGCSVIGDIFKAGVWVGVVVVIVIVVIIAFIVKMFK